MSNEPRSLKTVYEEAEKKRSELEGAYESTSPSYRDDLQQAISDYEECLHLIDKVSLFSPNEGVEDISTSDIPFLLVNYRLAELYQKVSSSSPQQRQAILRNARAAYERFLHILDNYSLLSGAYSKFFDQYTDDPESFSTISTKDAEARRNSKIANFKAEKEMRQKLEYLRSSPRYTDGGGGDEELVRDLHLANIQYCAHMTFQGLEGLNRENEILAQAPMPLFPQITTVEEDERRRMESERDDGYSERLDRPLRRLQSAFTGPILSQDGKPLRPFTLTGNRQELQNGVFRPGHNLPTMSIDEYLAEERRRGGIIEGGGEASGRQPEPDEDNIEKADIETLKAREWDDFKDDNPRGSGNTLNRG